MKFLKSIYHFFPVQLFLLHFRKSQVLLLFWFVLTSTVNGNLLKIFGADALLLAPEYLGNVNMLSAFITGIALGVFVMSWNITTFILHSPRFRFLATTRKPFLKYCINNCLIPLLFLVFYFIRLIQFNDDIELMSPLGIAGLLGGLLSGFILLCFISFAYFFGAELTINKTIAPLELHHEKLRERKAPFEFEDHFGLKVSTYINSFFMIKKPRIVKHYRKEYIDMVFKRHHIAAIVCIILAFIFLVVIGFFLENSYFEMPAAASILIFLAIMCALIGSLNYFLKSWSLPFAIVLIIFINFLYKKEIIDPRNKAYGLNYNNKSLRPAYNKKALVELCSPALQEADSLNMITVLENWKKNQSSEKPVMIFINVSGGGLRSAAFVMNTLQKIDSMGNGNLMKNTFMISGASGGMLSAAYYRELYRSKIHGSNIDLYNEKYNDNITRDLLNPVFTSMIARDLFAPSQKFSVDHLQYIKDRGYAFEKKLGDNTGNLLNIQIKDYAADEHAGLVPLLILNSVVKRDGRKMIVSSQPMRFMMKPAIYSKDTSVSPDAIDFAAMFTHQQPLNLRLLTALRMNATFPYILPNVWLPSEPVIDVMDAGLRDNFGQETTLRFLEHFQIWLKENLKRVIILQLRDRPKDNWQNPFETTSLTDMLVNPAMMLQHNLFKLQDYFQVDQFSYLQHKDNFFQRIGIMYMPEKPEKTAALNFHLSGREKVDVIQSFNNPFNRKALEELGVLLKNN